ncbi:MAG: hypothetical protein BMS9Abin15_0346 [Gammaproteobacteria bacterium]|nr:MAG: hypothetical protein BMS9Abin15_0346 [Gammaproteobacteria bacterium]
MRSLDKPWLLTRHLPYGATIQNAIDASGILDQVPKIDLTRTKWVRLAA